MNCSSFHDLGEHWRCRLEFWQGYATELASESPEIWDPCSSRFIGPSFDRKFDVQLGRPRYGLEPGQSVARAFAEVCQRQLASLPSIELRCVTAQAMARFMVTQHAEFPGNLFWDCDGLMAHAIELAGDQAATGDACRRVGQFFAAVGELEGMYGGSSVICFRYAHDFCLGFDWSKWVRRDPATRHGQGPFAQTFLDHLGRRAGELVQAIADNDDVYPELPGGQFRNPFSFAREPDDELRLFRALAAHDEIPVQAWLARAPDPVPRRDYGALRRARADLLGIARRPRGDGRRALNIDPSR